MRVKDVRALVRRLRTYAVGPATCPVCSALRATVGCGEPCSYKMDYGTHSSAIHGSERMAKEDMLEAAALLERSL